MKKIAVFAFFCFVGIMTSTVFGNPSITEETKTTYKRAFGSTKGIKEYAINTTHDASTKRVYNNSSKATNLVEAIPIIEKNAIRKLTVPFALLI